MKEMRTLVIVALHPQMLVYPVFFSSTFFYNEIALIISFSYMQLKKIVASIIQSHKNEVARDVKIMIDRRFAMLSEYILSAISEQSKIPKASSMRKFVDTRIHGSNVEATDATCNSTRHADCYTGPFHKSSGPLVMDDRQDPFMRPHLEDLLVGLQ
jgi:hypothetical protein